MRVTFEKIVAAILGLGLSVIATILGMYLVFNSEINFLHHLLYSIVFILQPVQTVILIRYLFLKPESLEEEEEEERDELDEEYDEFDAEEDAEEDGLSSEKAPLFSFRRKKEETNPHSSPLGDADGMPANKGGSQSAPRANAKNPSFAQPFKATYTPLPPVTPPQDPSDEEDPLAPFLVKPDIPVTSSQEGYSAHDTSTEVLGGMEKAAAEVADPDIDADEGISLASTLSKRVGEILGRR